MLLNSHARCFVPALRRALALAGLALAMPLVSWGATDAPVSPNAQPGVAATMRFFNNIAGRYVVSGQQEIAWDESRAEEDIDYIIANTGRTPAIRGFDFLKYSESPASRANQGSTPRAISWARSGGIVTFCYHMFVNIGSNNGQPQFYTPGSNGNPVGTDYDIRQAVIPGTPENVEFLAKLDIAAEELAILRDAGVPVIWRPFHESGGTWFWWSRYGAAPFKAAWQIMFERYTQMHGLTNLIWCFNPSNVSNLASWYPGDQFVDMISLDVYPTAGSHPTYSGEYIYMRNFTNGRKPVVMSETGSIPNIDNLLSEGGGWGYFCTWNGFGNDVSRHTVSFLNTVYNHPKVITLDELGAAYAEFSSAVALSSPSEAVARGGSVSLTASGSDTFQWRRNGTAIAAATSATLALTNVQPADTGLYTASASSSAAILGVSSTAKVIGTGTEVTPDVKHPNGNTFDQILLEGVAATITADHSLNQITRMSFIDLDDDIVQVEFSGPGTLSLVLTDASGPAAPLNYNQPSAAYMKGRAGIVITGATEQTNVSVFSVGRLTAYDPTGAYDIASPASETNDPDDNGNPLFTGRGASDYDGISDIAFIAIASANGRFGGVRTSNAHYSASTGHTGVYAPHVTFEGPVYVGDIDAEGDANPVLLLGSADNVRITGGDLAQTNAAPVRVSGITTLRFTAGGDSHNRPITAKTNQAVLLQNDVNVTSSIIAN